MKDNGKTEAVKNCTTCRHIGRLGKGVPCSECRMSYPPADADDYNLMWELRETLAEVKETREFKPGEMVMYGDMECTVLSVCHQDDDVLLELLKVEADATNFGEFTTMTRIMVPAICCAKAVKELTAKEYAEKLREYFGIEDPPVTHGKLCAAVICKECAFYEEPAWCEAAVMLFDPAAGMERIQAQNHKDKPKGKTYLEDFREKFPNCVLCSDGTPALCRCEAYGGNCAVSDYPEDEECVHCWNEVMPKTRDEK